MKLEHLSLIMGLTKSELKKRIELGLIDPQLLNIQLSDYSTDLKLDALCDSWRDRDGFEQVDKFEVTEKIQLNSELKA